jgi:hypothetical protein
MNQGICVCYPGFAGAACESCAAGHTYYSGRCLPVAATRSNASPATTPRGAPVAAAGGSASRSLSGWAFGIIGGAAMLALFVGFAAYAFWRRSRRTGRFSVGPSRLHHTRKVKHLSEIQGGGPATPRLSDGALPLVVGHARSSHGGSFLTGTRQSAPGGLPLLATDVDDGTRDAADDLEWLHAGLRVHSTAGSLTAAGGGGRSVGFALENASAAGGAPRGSLVGSPQGSVSGEDARVVSVRGTSDSMVGHSLHTPSHPERSFPGL